MACLQAASAPARATEEIWGALIMATNAATPEAPPPELDPYLSKLRGIFGYNQFKIVAQESESVGDVGRQWKLASKFLTVRIEPLASDGASHELALSMEREKQTLLEMKTRVGVGSPLLIRGPMCGRGQLVILLEVR